jgi:sensor histidine kinase YesM
MNFLKQRWVVHLMALCTFLTLPLVFTPPHAYDSFSQMVTDKFVVFNMMLYLCLLAFFYVHYYILLPNLYFKKRYGSYVTITLLVIVLFLFICMAFNIRPPHPHHHESINSLHGFDRRRGMHRRSHFRLPMHIMQLFFIYVMGILSTLFLRTNQYLKQLHEAHIKSQIKHLNAQINPHFLFNTFNSIYGLAIKENAPQTANGLLKLSDMMRHVVADSPNEQVALTKEIDYIENYIALQKLRLASNVKIQVDIQKNGNELYIAPLLLISFIENAFKHGVNPDKKSAIHIKLSVQQHELLLHVSNNKVNEKLNEVDSLGLGLDNAIKRLDLLYANQHKLTIDDQPLTFIIDLKLNLTV